MFPGRMPDALEQLRELRGMMGSGESSMGKTLRAIEQAGLS